MTLVKLRRFAQVTLPVELRDKFHLEEGDLLEAMAVKQGILLKPVTVVERGEAWKQLFEAMEKVKESKPRRKQTSQAQEKEIAGAVKAFRNKRG